MDIRRRDPIPDEEVLDIFKKNHAKEVKEAKSEAEATELWKARKSAYAVLARIKTHLSSKT